MIRVETKVFNLPWQQTIKRKFNYVILLQISEQFSFVQPLKPTFFLFLLFPPILISEQKQKLEFLFPFLYYYYHFCFLWGVEEKGEERGEEILNIRNLFFKKQPDRSSGKKNSSLKKNFLFSLHEGCRGCCCRCCCCTIAKK